MPSAAFDFYSPFVSAAIVTSSGDRFPLWTQRPELQGLSGSDTPGSLAFLNSVSVEMELGRVPRITAILAPPFEEGRRLLNSPVLEWGAAKLQVQYGYVGGSPDGAVLSPVYEGVLLKPGVSIGQDMTITLNAQGTGGFGSSRQKRGEIYKGTRAEIIQKVARGPNPEQPRSLRPNFTEVPIDAPEFELLFEQTRVESQGYLTDWALLWRLVRECQCTMLLVGDELQIFPTNTWMGKQPSRTLRLFDYPQGEIGPANGVFPLLSVESPTMAVYLDAGVRGLLMRDVDSKKAEETSKVIDDAATKPTRTGPGDGYREGDENLSDPAEDGEGAGFYSGEPNDPDVEAMARSEFKALQSSLGIHLEVSSLLDPTLLPGTVVAVQGVSKRHDSNYGVLKGRYAAGVGGFDMQLSLVNNASKIGAFGGLTGGGAAARLWQGEKNAKEPPNNSDKSIVPAVQRDPSEQIA